MNAARARGRPEFCKYLYIPLSCVFLMIIFLAEHMLGVHGVKWTEERGKGGKGGAGEAYVLYLRPHINNMYYMLIQGSTANA